MGSPEEGHVTMWQGDNVTDGTHGRGETRPGHRANGTRAAAEPRGHQGGWKRGRGSQGAPKRNKHLLRADQG